MRIMGVADGVIMPIIITAHMANTKANSIAVQGAVLGIIQPLPAGDHPETGHVHAANIHVGGEPPDIGPGERSHEGESHGHDQPIAPQHGLDCRIRHVALMHDAALAEMNFGELAVGVGKLQPDRARGLAPAAPDFGKGVFEPIDHVDAHAMLGPRHRIEDRLTAAFRHSRHDQARLSGGYIDLKVYRGKDRIMPFFQRGGEYVEDRRPGFRILPADDTQQRGSLRLRRPLVNYYYRFPFALMDGAGPAQDADEPESVEFGRAVMPALDLVPCDRMAVSVRRQPVELAGTAIGAVAVDELTPLDGPFGVRHGRLPPEESSLPARLNGSKRMRRSKGGAGVHLFRRHRYVSSRLPTSAVGALITIQIIMSQALRIPAGRSVI